MLQASIWWWLSKCVRKAPFSCQHDAFFPPTLAFPNAIKSPNKWSPKRVPTAMYFRTRMPRTLSLRGIKARVRIIYDLLVANSVATDMWKYTSASWYFNVSRVVSFRLGQGTPLTLFSPLSRFFLTASKLIANAIPLHVVVPREMQRFLEYYPSTRYGRIYDTVTKMQE